MVGNKFLHDDGEDDDVLCSEWATAGGVDLKQLNKLELAFLDAIVSTIICLVFSLHHNGHRLLT